MQNVDVFSRVFHLLSNGAIVFAVSSILRTHAHKEKTIFGNCAGIQPVFTA
jgi:hypothetical protein